MPQNAIALFIAVFLASAVEAVEAVTVVLAAGTARGFRSAGRGTIAALITLAAIVAIAGPSISSLPMEALRLVIGALLLVFGLQWLRKAILRYSGFKAMHDEDKIFQDELAAASASKKQSRFGVDDWYAFTMAYKAVLLEGLEVAFIVVTFGAIQKAVDVAAWGALAAVAVVTAAGFAARKPLATVPENTLKFVVGIMLTSFGTFWAAEGAGAVWPGTDFAILVLIVLYLVVAYLLIRTLSARKQNHKVVETKAQTIEPSEAEEVEIIQGKNRGILRGVRAFGLFWYDFIIGDDWRVAAGIAAGLVVTAIVSGAALAFLVLPIAVVAMIGNTALRASR